MVKSSSVKSFWVAFFALLSAVAIACGVLFGVLTTSKLKRVRMSTINDENYYKVAVENGYKQSLYLACDSLKNMDANLGKVAVSHDVKHQAEMLARLSSCANEVNNQLANLPIEGRVCLQKCEKFANQTQDYATFLVGKLASGQSLSQQDRTNLKNLQRVAQNLYDVFQNYAESDSAMFITNGCGLEGVGDLTDMLNQAQDNAFEYEKLIYDGPFSDSVEQKSIKCDKKITPQQGSQVVQEYFGENKFLHQIKGKCPMFVYQTQKGEVTLTADGKVVEYEATQQFEGKKIYKMDKCIQIAQEFCQKLGYDVQGIWVSNLQDYVTYVNCAPVVDGVIVYPELIKVAVDTSSGEVVGLEAKAYLTNHVERQIQWGNISQEQCRQKIDQTLRVTNVAKSLVQVNNKEFCAYEFECTDGQNQYYVYVDSATGKEITIFKVIANTEGHTVM